MREAKRVPLMVAAKDVVADLERFGRNQGPGPDKRLATLKTAIKSGKTPDLLSATKAIVDDLERFNRTQGPGPGNRLGSLKAAITRGILGEAKLPGRPDFLLVRRFRDTGKWGVQRFGKFRFGERGAPGSIKTLESGIESESRAIAVAKQIAKKTGEEVQVDRSKKRK
jgi:hypothetical protein